MTNITCLPDEVLLITLSFIDSLPQLKECRLVCKAWCNPAETIMLGQHITIKSENNLFRLYDVLVRNPQKGYHIKHLKFDNGDEFSPVLRELLYLAITPNIETLAGVASSDDFYNTLNNIIARTPMKFDKLRTMTTSTYPVGAPYFETLYHFRNSLESMVFYVGEFPDKGVYDYAQRLVEFKKLTSFKMQAWSGRLWDVDRVLKYCPYIQDLTLEINYDSDDLMDKDEVRVWTSSSVDKQYNLKTLKIESEGPADYLEYMFFKYPNIEKVLIDVELDDEYLEMNFHRIADLIKNIPQTQILFTVSPGIDFRDVVRILKSNNYKVIIEDINHNDDFRIRIQAI